MSDDLSAVQLHLVDDLDSANEMMRWLGERRETDIAVDTETEGLNPEHHKVRLAQLGDAMRGWSIPWEQWGGVFKEAMRKYDGQIVAHNLKFDAAMIRLTCGIDLPRDRCDDTRLMAHVLEPTHSTALKQLCVRHVDPRAGGLQDQLGHSLSSGNADNGWTWATVPVDFEPYWTYAALDTVLTSRLSAVLKPRVIEAGALRAYELELASSWVCETMERNGIPVDRDFAGVAYDSFKGYAQQLSDWCKTHYDVRPTQNASVAQALINEGVELSETTKTGAVALDKDVLGPVEHPLAQVVLQHRQYTKLANTYIKNFLKMTSDDDPLLRPRINTVGARTGRMSMDTPNLQNLPRRSDDNPAAITVRNCLVASAERTLLMIDYDQIELRLLAHLAGDEGLRTAFWDPNLDVFTASARELFDDPSIVKSDPRRQHTKNAYYAMSYGAGAPKFAATAGLSLEQGQDVYNRIDQRNPGIRELGRRVEAKALERLRDEGVAYARSPLTGRRHLPDDDRMYTLVNYLVQGTAAELLKMKLVELDMAGFGPYLCLPVHDEVVFNVPTEDLNEFARAACDVMSDDGLISVPVTVGAATGTRWGEKKDYDL